MTKPLLAEFSDAESLVSAAIRLKQQGHQLLDAFTPFRLPDLDDVLPVRPPRVRLAMLFGGSRGAWIGACLLQGALFGAAHAYQNPLGIVITGTLGILMGLLVLASGRNLWPVIIGHGLFDASRFVLFYFQGPPM